MYREYNWMDIFAHMLWTNVLYRKRYLHDVKNRLWAVFFGVVPDLLAFTPATIYAFFHAGNRDHLMSLASSNLWVFAWARHAYNFTHSAIIFAVGIILVAAFRKGRVWWPMLGWGLHILIDFFTHPDFYQTPVFFPLSNYKNNHGISWANPKFMLVNYSLLAISYIVIFFLWRKSKHAQS